MEELCLDSNYDGRIRGLQLKVNKKKQWNEIDT